MATYYIIDGPDGAGKTTLVKKIAAAHPGAVLLHFGKPETQEEEKNYWQLYLQAIKDNAENSAVIFDRSWYSDMVYGPIMRGACEMTQFKKEILEMAVKACGGGIIIYCTGTPKILWKRCQQRGETYITSAECLADIKEAFDKVMKSSSILPIIKYDTTK